MDSVMTVTGTQSPVKSQMYNGSASSSDPLGGSGVSSTEGSEISSSTQNGEIKNNGHSHSSSSEKKHKHKDKHKDKHKHKHHKHDKDRDRHSSSSKDKDKDRKSSSDKHKSESSRSESKSPEKIKIKTEGNGTSSVVSSSSSPSKDKDREKDRHRDKDNKSHKSKHKDKHREKDQSRDSERKVQIKEEVEDVKVKVKPEVDSEDDIPLSRRTKPNISMKEESDDEDDVPLAQRNGKKRKAKSESETDDDVPLRQRVNKKIKTEPVKKKPPPKKRARSSSEEDSEEDSDESDYGKSKSKKKPKTAPSRSSTTKSKSASQSSRNSSASSSPTKKGGRKPKEEEPEEVWEWWKEAPREDGVKWNFLEHKGPVFAPEYEPLPKGVKFRYNGKSMVLSPAAEEVAGFYSRFIEHDYTTKEVFNKNFFKDWRRLMTKEEKDVITDLKKCDFTDINNYYKQKSEERKAMSKDEKLKLKEENEAITKEYGICMLDGHKEKIGNFRIEPPGLFRGRGEHPKMGMLKTRVIPEDVIINCSKDSKFPKPPPGHKWKEVRHDNTVSWLASWTENVQGQVKYVMLNPTSRLKGEKDWMKYEKARELAKKIDKIRENYKHDFKSKEMRIRQRAVAMYFIDKLALRAGNEKDEDQADTVGCCSLRYEHIKLYEEKNGKENVVEFDFLGKDSIRYQNEVSVEKRVFKNLQLFLNNKKDGDDLFDRLNTTILNKHLSELMEGLSAKVFRTYNASHTLQQQLDELTPKKGTVAEKVLAYNRANRAVAILCNHQRAAPKSHEKSMENLINKIEQKQADVKDLKREVKNLPKKSKEYEKKHNALKRAEEQLAKLKINRDDKEEGKEIALGTSKLNYLDPRITVAWCKKHDVPIEKAYNKTQRAKFRWAIDMVDETYRFD